MALPLAAVAVAAGAFVFPILTGQGPIPRAMNYAMNYAWSNAIPDPITLIEMRWRGLLPEDKFVEYMKDQGFNKDASDKLFNTVQALLTPAELIHAKWRGLLDEKEFKELVRRNKVTQETIDKIEKVMEFRPGAGDIVRFAVREVFRDDIVKKFGMDEFFPTPEDIARVEEMSPAARKDLLGMDKLIAQGLEIGMPPDQLRNFWRAHWILPSIGEGTEMFHRLNPEWEQEHPVTDADFEELLRVQDVMPYWIPRLKKVLFTLPTRVDIRRMLRDGHITDEEATRFYRMRGYDPENAHLMVELGKTMYKQEDRELSRALITRGFNEGEITEDDAIELVESLGYSKDDSTLIVRLEEIKNEDAEMDEKIKVLKLQFKRGVIDEPALTSELDALNLSALHRDKVLLQTISEKKAVIVLPSKEDVQKFLKAGIIKKDEAKIMLTDRGIREKDISKYMKLWEAV